MKEEYLKSTLKKLGLLDEADELELYVSLSRRDRAVSKTGRSKPFP